MDLIKVRFLRNGKASGRPYTYETPVPVKVGNLVQVNNNSVGEVVEVDVPESEIKDFRGMLKCIVGIAKDASEEGVECNGADN